MKHTHTQQQCEEGKKKKSLQWTLMSTAVRQQLIVMLICKLLPPSLHTFSSPFVLSLSLFPHFLRHSLLQPFPLLLPAVTLFLILSGSPSSSFLYISFSSTHFSLLSILPPRPPHPLLAFYLVLSFPVALSFPVPPLP